MKNRVASINLVIALAALLALPAAASAADCGGGTPCACGDSVAASRTLVPGVDPVLGTVCPVDGLIMVTDGVILDLGGGTLRGAGPGDGVRVGAPKVKPGNTTIRNGNIENFKQGINVINASRNVTQPEERTTRS